MRIEDNKMIWDKLAKRYDNLWVQKYSLMPTRKMVFKYIEHYRDKPSSFLDVGCGTGQLLLDILNKYPQDSIFGCDKSDEMIQIATQKKMNAKLFQLDVSTDKLEGFSKNSFDFITCCHSFPYYSNKSFVLKQLSSLLRDDGIAIFVQASVNTLYDKIVMKVIEATAEKAGYLSRVDFLKIAEEYFIVNEQFEVREKWFMPSICGFVMRKRL